MSRYESEDAEGSPEPRSPSDSGLSSRRLSSGQGGSNSIAKDWQIKWDAISKQLDFVPFSIKITSPECIGTMMTKYVVYNVRTDPAGFAVKRRYNDFAWLRESLINAYPGLFIPALPTTSGFRGRTAGGGKTDVESDYVKNRLTQLQLFLNKLSKIPFLKTDSSLLGFLSITGDKEYKSFMDAKDKAFKDNGKEDSEGSIFWEKLLSDVPPPSEVNKAIGDMKRQLDLLHSITQKIEDTAFACGKSCKQFSKNLGFLSTFVTAWNKIEIDVSDPLTNEYPNTYGPTMKYWMTGLVTAVAHFSEQAKLTPKIFAVVLLGNLQFQLAEIENFIEFIKGYEKLLNELEKAEKAKNKAFEEKMNSPDQPKSSFFSMGSKDVVENYNKKVRNVEYITNKVQMTIKGLIFCEVDRFHAERVNGLTALLNSFVAVNLQAAKKNLENWMSTAATISLNATEYEAQVQLVYTATDEEVFNDESK